MHVLQTMDSLFMAKACQRIQLSWKQLEGRTSNQQWVHHHIKLGARHPYRHHARSASLFTSPTCTIVDILHFKFLGVSGCIWVYSDGTSSSTTSQRVHVVYLSFKLCVCVFLFQQLACELTTVGCQYSWHSHEPVMNKLCRLAYVHLVLIDKVVHTHTGKAIKAKHFDLCLNALLVSCSV